MTTAELYIIIFETLHYRYLLKNKNDIIYDTIYFCLDIYSSEMFNKNKRWNVYTIIVIANWCQAKDTPKLF